MRLKPMGSDCCHAASRPLAVRAREAARLLGIGERTLATWTRRGIIPSVKIGHTRDRKSVV